MFRFLPLGAANHLSYVMDIRGGEYTYAEECKYWRKRELCGEIVSAGYTYINKGPRYPRACEVAYELTKEYRYKHEVDAYRRDDWQRKLWKEDQRRRQALYRQKRRERAQSKHEFVTVSNYGQQHMFEVGKNGKHKLLAYACDGDDRACLIAPDGDIRVVFMGDNNVRMLSLNGREYELHKLPATKALVLMTRLSRLFGDSLVRVMLIAGGVEAAKTETGSNQNGNEHKQERKEATPEQLQALAEKLQVFGQLKDSDVLDLVHIVFPCVLLNNAQLYKTGERDEYIDLKFANGYELDVLPVLWGAISYNLGPFMQGFLKRLPNVPIPVASNQ